MAEKLNKRSVALSLGVLFSITHTINILLIQLGVVKYAERLHFISMPYTLQQFSFVTLIAGIVAAFIVGAVIGWIFTGLYNYFSRKNK